MNKAASWKTNSESYINFALALRDLENQLCKMGGRIGNIEKVTYGPDGCIEAKIGIVFKHSELQEYISQLPLPVSGNSSVPPA